MHKTALDYFKGNNENDESQRVFYIFTNGFDKELVLYEQLKKKFLIKKKILLFSFFQKPKE